MRQRLQKAIPFAIVAVLEAILAERLAREGGTPNAVVAGGLLWAGLATMWVALAYATDRPGLLGKSRGLLPLLGPFLLLAILVARVARRVGVTERSEVVPGLFVGGWPSPESDTLFQLDCTSELPRRGRALAYVSEPMLDGLPVRPEVLRRAIQQVQAWRLAGQPVLVHCAFGHGRSVAVVAAILVLEGHSTSLGDAFVRIRLLRPGARLSRAQVRAVAQALDGFGNPAHCGYDEPNPVTP